VNGVTGPFKMSGPCHKPWYVMRKMSMLQRLILKLAGFVGVNVTAFGASEPGKPPQGFEGMVNEGYGGNPDVRASLDALAWTLSGIDWQVKRIDRTVARDQWEVLGDHPFYDLWATPNPIQTQEEYLDMLVLMWFMGGEAFTHIVTVGTEAKPEPAELWLLRPDRVEVVRGKEFQDPITEYRFRKGTDPTDKGIPIDPLNMMHIKFGNPLNQLRGMSPLRASAVSIDAGNEGRRWNLAMIRNGGKASGAMTLKDGSMEIDPDTQRPAIERQIVEKMTGPDNAGRMHFIEGAWEWLELGKTQTDMDWGGGLQTSLKDISKTAGVNPEIIGDRANATYSNYEQSRASFYTEAILPLLNRLRGRINTDIMKLYADGTCVDYRTDNVEALQENTTDKFARLKGAKWMTINEQRTDTGQESIDGGDALILSPTDLVVPVEELGLFSDDTSTEGVDDEKALPFSW